ncbi:MAG: D-amino-acid transaminase [Inquilinus sp.]|nr:D-amino-acid transaminase [Inquilinus sp.]
MPRYAYVNGRYLPHDAAGVHIEDRGFQFADGVYEVVTIQGGRLVDEAGHLDRLGRSLGELRLAWPMDRPVLQQVMRQLIRRNRVRDGIIYLQITRGTAARDFRFPEAATPTLVMTTRRMNLDPARQVAAGVDVVTIPDIRWKRRDIKSVALLAQVLGKQQAAEAGAFEAWQIDEEGMVTEGCSSNAWIVTGDGRLVTRDASTMILNGITRQSILRLAAEQGLQFEERAFTVDEARRAREAFLSSATTYVMPVTRIDGRPVADGKPGPLSRKLRESYRSYAVGAGAS